MNDAEEKYNDAEELILQYEAVCFIPTHLSYRLLRVLVGGFTSEQSVPFKNAFRCSKLSGCVVEYAHVSEIRKLRWTPQNLVEWLLSSHFHFIICHPHQGLDGLEWNLRELYKELQRLKHHNGFPMGRELTCPIFSQDKYGYINLLQKQKLSIPTKQLLVSQILNEKNKLSIDRFLRANMDEDGFIIKGPFTTNSHCIAYVKPRKVHKEDDLLARVLKVAVRMAANHRGLPYLLLQPCLKNRKEYKIVVQNYEAQYVCSIQQQRHGQVSFSKPPHTKLMSFAEYAVKYFAESCPEAIVNGTVRVDIMTRSNGEWVINEFESLEAVISSGAHNAEMRAKYNQYLYWVNILHRIK